MRKFFQALVGVALFAAPSFVSAQTIGDHVYSYDEGGFSPSGGVNTPATWGQLITAPVGANSLINFNFYMFGGQPANGDPCLADGCEPIQNDDASGPNPAYVPADNAHFNFNAYLYSWTDGVGIGAALPIYSSGGIAAPTTDCGDPNGYVAGCMRGTGSISVPVVGGQLYLLAISAGGPIDPSNYGALYHISSHDPNQDADLPPGDNYATSLGVVAPFTYTGTDVALAGAGAYTAVLCNDSISDCTGAGFGAGDDQFSTLGTNLTFDATFSEAQAVSPTPEPASLTLLATGLLGIGAVVRRRRKASVTG